MEQIVRPFQLLDPTTTISIPIVRDKVDVSPAHICWGAAGTLPTPVQQDDNFDGVNFRLEECDTHSVEDSRDTEDLVVQNPNNPSVFVVVQRIRKINLKRAAKKDFLGVFHTDTTDYGLPDLFASSPFGDVSKQNKCTDQVYYNR